MPERLEQDRKKLTRPERIDGVSPAEYARTHGLTINYVYLLIWNGKLAAEKLYGRWFITPSDTENGSDRKSSGSEATLSTKTGVL